MRVYECDRCGKYIPELREPRYFRKPTRGVYRFGKKRHLCHECAQSFDVWLTEVRRERREQEDQAR